MLPLGQMQRHLIGHLSEQFILQIVDPRSARVQPNSQVFWIIKVQHVQQSHQVHKRVGYTTQVMYDNHFLSHEGNIVVGSRKGT